MSGMMESVSIANSVLRTLLALVVLGGVGLGSWFGYQSYYAQDLAMQQKDQQLLDVQAELQFKDQSLAQQRQELERRKTELVEKQQELVRQQSVIDEQGVEIVRLEDDVREKEQQIEKLDTALRLLKVDQRLARVHVLEVEEDPDSGEVFATVEFVELDDKGQVLDQPRQFRLKGDMLYVDYWVVKFDEQYVEQADLQRGTSICLFRRIFGEFQEPRDGYQLDQPGARPKAYGRNGAMTEFETKIWDDFWNIANNPTHARTLGIRAAHGEAVSIRVQQGMTYKLQLRASDGLSIVPDPDADPPTPPRKPVG